MLNERECFFMTVIRAEVVSKIPDRRLEGWARAAREYLSVPLETLDEIKVYKFQADVSGLKADIAGKGAQALIDPILQKLHLDAEKYTFPSGEPSFVIEVSCRPGVTDNAARAAEEALDLVGIRAKVASGSLYFLFGSRLTKDGAEKVAKELLANDLIQKADIWPANDFYKQPRFSKVSLPEVTFGHAPRVDAVSLDLDDAGLEKLSKDRCLALSVSEMKHIREHYRRLTDRAARRLPPQPTDVELEIIAQSWSEHCKHKIFAATIDYTDPNGNGKKIESLYKTYIKRATKEVEAERKLGWLVSVFSDNAGIVRFDPNVDLCIKVETHNSPSALDPYGGALTGILGVNRDILGAGLGARPIANTDVFCFAPPDLPGLGEAAFMPEGPKSPRRILEGVHKGVEDGGNKSGIPTVNGAFFFDRDYAGKPLVFVGTVGVLPPVLPDGRLSHEKTPSPGDRVFMVGGAIGADGIHGATFSSLELDQNAPATAVQIGDPLTQKRMADLLLEARDLGLYSAITDNGAGGLSSSVGEMALMTNGAFIDLALCPVKYPGLSPWELMVSESQERMTVAVPETNKAAFLDLAARRGVMATDIGAFENSGRLRVFYKDRIVGELDLKFLHDSLPPLELKAHWTGPKPRPAWSPTTHLKDRRQPSPKDVGEALLTLLAVPNITSKEKWVRGYDHEVQAATHMKPFVGVKGDGPADGGVIWLHPHGGAEKSAVAIGCGMAPRLSLMDPGLMAVAAVDEAVRNVVVAGGDPDMCCLLDNFCWPDPVLSAKNPDGAYKLGQLVRACQGLYDVCRIYGMPLVSGKDSMKNDFKGKDRRGDDIAVSVLPTLMITAMARVTLGDSVSSDFKAFDDLIYLLGPSGPHGLALSEFAHSFVLTDTKAPGIDMARNIALYRAYHKALKQGIVRSAHDLSEGGLLVAVAESMIGGRLGAKLDLPEGDVFDVCFNEAPGRILVSVSPDMKSRFEMHFRDVGFTLIGEVTDDENLSVAGVNVPLEKIVEAWKKGF